MVDVVVVNWNSGHQLKACVQSVLSNAPADFSKITVVDNGSFDGSANFSSDCPPIELIQTGANLGFGRACNLGAVGGSAEFLLFLNPDAGLCEGTLQKALAFMRSPSNARTGICGVQLTDAFGRVARSCARFPSVSGFLSRAIGLDRVVPRSSHMMTDWNHSSTRTVDHVMGAFFLVRRSLFEKLGGFDEQFFVYLEDVDFSRRAFLAGWKSVYLADAQAFHAGGGTSNQVKAARLFYSLRSRLLYANKHFSKPGAALVMLFTLGLEPVSRLALALAQRSLKSLRETLAAYGLLWRWLPQWVLKGTTR
jgi:GT2 family glycosyltransferase